MPDADTIKLSRNLRVRASHLIFAEQQGAAGMGVVENIAIAVITGVVASACFWYLQSIQFRPKVLICPTLAKYYTEDNKPVCEVKLFNKRRRAAADVAVTINLVVPGLVKSGQNSVLPLREEQLRWLPGKDDYYYSVSPNYLTAELRDRYRESFPEEIKTALDSGADDLSFWRVLELCKGASLKVYLAASDSFFGGRSFVAQVFQLSDIRNGPFKDGRTCEHDGPAQEPVADHSAKEPDRLPQIARQV
jgi:hypothetical protein